jgi:dGTPase
MNVRARLEVQAGEREVINALVAAYRADPGRLDRDLRADHDAATSEEGGAAGRH